MTSLRPSIRAGGGLTGTGHAGQGKEQDAFEARGHPVGKQRPRFGKPYELPPQPRIGKPYALPPQPCSSVFQHWQSLCPCQVDVIMDLHLIMSKDLLKVLVCKSIIRTLPENPFMLSSAWVQTLQCWKVIRKELKTI